MVRDMSRITFRQYARMLVGKPLRGSVSDANSWAWIIGPLGIGGLTSLGLGRMINVDHLSPVQNGLLYFAATLAFAYLIRLLIWAPYERYRELDAKNRELAAPPQRP